MVMPQREEEIARLQAEREEYEARLPPAIRADIEFRRSRGFDVPYRPIPEAQLRVLEAAGPDATQAQIQWAYAMRDRAERQARDAAPPAPSASYGRADNPMAMPDEMGRMPEAAVGPEERVSGAPSDDVSQEEIDAERARIRSSIESNTGGAPEVQVYGETPPSYMRDLEAATDMAARSDSQTWLDPNNPEAFGLESDLLQYREGMTDEEYNAAKANIRHRQRLLRGMGPDQGGYTAFNPQQPMWLGTAEDQAEWEAFLRDNPDAQRRYDPAAYQANRAAADEAAAQKHGEKLRTKYGGDAERAYLESQQSGQPMDMNMVRTDREKEMIADRQDDEMYARRGNNEARARLQSQDDRSGRSGAMTNERLVPGGSGETFGNRFARRSEEREAELEARRRAYSARNMLAGNDPRSNLTNAFNLLPPEEQTAAILGMMFPQGATPLDVQRANNEQLAELGQRVALGQGFQAPTAMEQAAMEAQEAQRRAEMFDDVTNHIRVNYSGGQGILNSEFDYEEREKTVRYVMGKYGISRPEAEAIVDAASGQFKGGASSQSPQAPPADAELPPVTPAPAGRSGARQGGGRSGRAGGLRLPPAAGRGRSGTRPGVSTPRSR